MHNNNVIKKSKGEKERRHLPASCRRPARRGYDAGLLLKWTAQTAHLTSWAWVCFFLVHVQLRSHKPIVLPCAHEL